MKKEPDNVIVNWLNNYAIESLRISSITILEIKYGINLLSNGKKKEQLKSAFDSLIKQKFNKRILDFDKSSALLCAELAAKLKMKGKNISIEDIQIAGIALANNAFIATRNEKHFIDSGAKVINPYN